MIVDELKEFLHNKGFLTMSIAGRENGMAIECLHKEDGTTLFILKDPERISKHIKESFSKYFD